MSTSYNERGDSWERQDGKFGKLFQPLGLSADGNEFDALYSADGGPEQLIKENLATGARTTLFADPRGDVELHRTGDRGGLPFAAFSNVGIPVTQYIDSGNEDDKKLHKLLSAQFPGRFVSFHGRHPRRQDGAVQGDQRPPASRSITCCTATP